jgi:hypothetical protein
MRAIPGIKSELDVNVEFASPGEFIPLPPDWRERSEFVGREGNLTFRHFDFYFRMIEPELYRFPAIDSADFAGSVEAVLA